MPEPITAEQLEERRNQHTNCVYFLNSAEVDYIIACLREHEERAAVSASGAITENITGFWRSDDKGDLDLIVEGKLAGWVFRTKDGWLAEHSLPGGGYWQVNCATLAAAKAAVEKAVRG